MYYFETKTLMIYVNHPLYDLHDVLNALFFNKTLMIKVLISICVQFFIGE